MLSSILKNGMFVFQKLSKLNYKYYINRVKKMIDDFSPNTEWSVWDTFYKYKPSMDIKNWIPPFKSEYL